MIGVVVWSDASREKAVIWCEDQAALAYLQGWSELSDPARWPEPGDLLELDSEMIGNLRHARKVTLLSDRGRSELPGLLQQAAENTRADSHLRLVSSRQCRNTDQPRCPETDEPIRAGASR